MPSIEQIPGAVMSKMKGWLEGVSWVDAVCLLIVVAVTGYASIESI